MTDQLPPKTRVQRAIVFINKLADPIEKYYPLVFGGACFGLMWRVPLTDSLFREIVDKVLPTATSVAAILAGFQGAGQAVLLGILDSGTIAYLKRVGKYKRLVSYLWKAIFSLLLASILMLLVIVLGVYGKPAWLGNSLILSGLAGLTIYAIAASYRINHLMFRVLSLENKESGRPPACRIPEPMP